MSSKPHDRLRKIIKLKHKYFENGLGLSLNYYVICPKTDAQQQISLMIILTNNGIFPCPSCFTRLDSSKLEKYSGGLIIE